MDCSPPDSSVQRIFQARLLEWFAIFFSRESSQPRDQTVFSCVYCFGRQILYHRATWEALDNDRLLKVWKTVTGILNPSTLKQHSFLVQNFQSTYIFIRILQSKDCIMDILSVMIAGGLGLKQGLGSQAETEARSWEWKHKILALDQWSVARALVLQLCRKEFSWRWKVVKQVFIGRKKSTVHIDRHMGILRDRVTESHPRGNLNSFYGTFLLGFLWPIILICLVRSSYLVYLRIFPCVCMHVLAQLGPVAKICG